KEATSLICNETVAKQNSGEQGESGRFYHTVAIRRDSAIRLSRVINGQRRRLAVPTMRRSNGSTSTANAYAAATSSHVNGSTRNAPVVSTRSFHSENGTGERTLPLSTNKASSKKQTLGM